MKFGQEFQQALESDEFPASWRESAIQYKHLKKCIKKIHLELASIGLSSATLASMNEWIGDTDGDATRKPTTLTKSKKEGKQSDGDRGDGDDTATPRSDSLYFSAATPTLSTVAEEFSPQLRVLVDDATGIPLDATLAPETRASLQKLAQHEMVTAGRKHSIGAPGGVGGGAVGGAPAGGTGAGTGAAAAAPSTHHVWTMPTNHSERRDSEATTMTTTTLDGEIPPSTGTARWIQIPLASAKDFFDLLSPKLEELEQLREAETHKLEEAIMDLGDAVEDVVEPVREGYEATRSISYRDLYFWREMFRLYLEQPIFYSETEQRRGALTFREAKSRLEAYDAQLRSTGLLKKLRTPLAQKTAKQFLDLNVEILKIMHFQEMNARAMTKILKKFDKRTHLEGEGASFLRSVRARYPALLTHSSNPKRALTSFSDSIARDLNAELATKVLAIVPQLDDWICPVCYAMAWRPVNLGCCRSVFCIRCIIRLQDDGCRRCPVCNREGAVARADGRFIDFDAMDFLEKFFPLEVKSRQKENEKAALVREYGEEFVRPGCRLM